MNLVHIHLVLTHFPVAGVLFLLILLTLALYWKSTQVGRAACVVAIVIASLSIPLYLTGEAAEEAVEHLAGVSEQAIEEHEESAEVGFVAIEILGVLSLIGLALSRNGRDFPRAFVFLLLFVTLLSAALIGWTANLGGKIRHTEIAGRANLASPD